MAQPEGVIPSQEDLLAELQALKLANPEMGAKRLQAAVKEKNPTWLVSADRVRKVQKGRQNSLGPQSRIEQLPVLDWWEFPSTICQVANLHPATPAGIAIGVTKSCD